MPTLQNAMQRKAAQEESHARHLRESRPKLDQHFAQQKAMHDARRAVRSRVAAQLRERLTQLANQDA